MALMDEARRERMAKAVRRAFLRALQGRKLIGELDEAALEIAVDTQVIVLFLDLLHEALWCFIRGGCRFVSRCLSRA